MFELNDKNGMNRNNSECDYVRFSLSEINTINTANSQIYNKKPREDSRVFLLKSYLDLDFDVLHAATGNRYVDDDYIWLINLAAIALFSNNMLTISSRKHLEKIEQSHIVC